MSFFKKIKKNKKLTFFLDISQQHYLLHKESARKLITQKVEFFAQKYNFEYNRIAIKNTKTRWGSCSVKKNLNFNYRILFLPEGLQDYIIVHELCHLKEMNHSKRFWQEVENILPDYKNSLKELKKQTSVIIL